MKQEPMVTGSAVINYLIHSPYAVPVILAAGSVFFGVWAVAEALNGSLFFGTIFFFGVFSGYLMQDIVTRYTRELYWLAAKKDLPKMTEEILYRMHMDVCRRIEQETGIKIIPVSVSAEGPDEQTLEKSKLN